MASLNTRNFAPGFPYQLGVSGTTNGGPLTTIMPAVAADRTTTDTYVFQIVVTNTTGGALTSVGAAGTTVLNFPEGLFFKGGLNWVASATPGLNANIVAFYK